MSFATSARVLLAVTGFGLAVVAFSQAPKGDPKAAPARKPWTTSKITGSPEPPPPFKAVRAFPEIKFDHPLLITRCPGTDRLFVGEQNGVLYSFPNTPDAKRELFFDLRKEVKTVGKHPGAKDIEAVYGLVFHPKFEQNRTCFVCYTLRPKDGKIKNLPDGSRVSRFKVKDTNPPRIDPDSEEILLTFLQGGHNAGDLHFGPDGMLYISTGDAADPNPPDPLNTGQDCSDLLSSILRIDVDHTDAGKHYAVPKDNPFVNTPGVMPEIWAYGFRNPWRMSFDRKTGDLWVGDVGWELWEMVHKIEKGGNYGWSIVEARQSIRPDQKIGPTPIRPPMIELPHTLAASVTGGYVYRGAKFPELQGAYIFADWDTRRVWAARFEGDRLKEMPEITKPSVRVVAFGEDNAGELYYLDYDAGTVHTLERNDRAGQNTNFPTKLSDTGLFSNTQRLEPAEGVIPFDPAVRMWQDGAAGEYLLGLPGLSQITLHPEGKSIPSQVDWHKFRMHFPKDAVLVKTIRTECDCSHFKIETQILHFDGEDWRGYTYSWRPDGSDADLVPADGGEKMVKADEFQRVSASREIPWTLHSRAQCITCHNFWAENALAFNVAQLNFDREGKGNELARLTTEGFIRRVGNDGKPLPNFDDRALAKEPSLGVKDGNAEKLARAYLHVNCSHCHRFGGGGGAVVLELDHTKPLKETGLIDARPKQGDFGIPDARLVAPGDPGRSVLLYRMAKFGRGHMPHIGAELPDITGLNLLESWIGGKEYKPVEAVNVEVDGLDTKLKSFGTALPLTRLMAFHAAALKPKQDKILEAVAKMEPSPVRELFEGYLPPDPKGRKIGTSPRPAALLALAGDAKKGEELFFHKDLKCATCHKVGDKGVALGPDLSTIGKTRTRPELLESLLEPSRRVEPQYAAYLVKTADGRSIIGLLVKRDDKQLVLKDAENKEIALAAGDVESVQPSRVSLMPEGLIAGLTPQEAADLLAYLAARK